MPTNVNDQAEGVQGLLQNVRIVLVNTTHTGNIGAAARAMKNMGLSNLALVAPKKQPDEDAYARSSRADEILDQAVTFENLESAVSGCQLVIGTSARQRNLCWPLITPRQMADEVAQAVIAQQDAQIALVFGREDRGLTNEELALCHFHVNIPTDESFSSLNVAAAVQVLVYELRVKWLELQNKTLPDWRDDWDVDWADAADVERFYLHLEQVLIGLDFYDPDNPRNLMQRLRRLYQRARLDQTELNILRGILTATEKSAGLQHKK
ncbi:RNA methyltransferase [Oceanospirillum sp.]|uniref:RNA methyltransferase n=1 Tax=Oceanospirillum sp. TaxID=2021254 RepID=UPI003A8EAC55